MQGRPLKKKNQIHIDSIKVVEKVDDEEEFVGKANVFQVDRIKLKHTFYVSDLAGRIFVEIFLYLTDSIWWRERDVHVVYHSVHVSAARYLDYSFTRRCKFWLHQLCSVDYFYFIENTIVVVLRCLLNCFIFIFGNSADSAKCCSKHALSSEGVQLLQATVQLLSGSGYQSTGMYIVRLSSELPTSSCLYASYFTCSFTYCWAESRATTPKST